ncbi:hypothetical protein D7231_32005 [Streptomyces klenkii]|uniref:Uncharacterized protein n=1 Tax=Streptomyces klenkii TaxID=1420899 RepID=A0A3B0AR81_9ACTN|nr:hypothetical protein [Streptomyces klenkii]RKN61897.1 hypothetical protein D7231_32005 [Streptomyces klenkii]
MTRLTPLRALLGGARPAPRPHHRMDHPGDPTVIIYPSGYAAPHTATKVGFVGPLAPLGRRIGRPSTASGRLSQRIHEARRDDGRVQLAPGMLVVHDRRPWRVLTITEREPALWPADYQTAFEDHHATWMRCLVDGTAWGDEPQRATWYQRPYAIALAPDGREDDPEAELHLIAPASHAWQVLPEHYAICRACGDLAPCRHETAEHQADEETALARVRLTFPPDACMGCGEAIAGRQKSVTFPGPNLWRPDLRGPARFHARNDCASWVDVYRRDWQAAQQTAAQAQPTDAGDDR